MNELLRTTGEGMGVSLETLDRDAIREIDWHRADLSGVALNGLSFDEASMRNAVLKGADGANCSFARANCILGSFRGAVFLDTSFAGAKLRYADFSGATLRNVNFDGADLTDAKFNGADVEGSTFVGAQAANTTFTGSNILDAQLQMMDA